MTLLGSIALVGLVSALVFGLMVEDRICSRLRARHPDLWRQLGSPDRVFDDGGLMRHTALAKLFGRPDLLRLCSADIAREVRFLRSFGWICFAAVFVAVAASIGYVLTQV
jgi:hypothetical protein